MESLPRGRRRGGRGRRGRQPAVRARPRGAVAARRLGAGGAGGGAAGAAGVRARTRPWAVPSQRGPLPRAGGGMGPPGRRPRGPPGRSLTQSGGRAPSRAPGGAGRSRTRPGAAPGGRRALAPKSGHPRRTRRPRAARRRPRAERAAAAARPPRLGGGRAPARPPGRAGGGGVSAGLRNAAPTVIRSSFTFLRMMSLSTRFISCQQPERRALSPTTFDQVRVAARARVHGLDRRGSQHLAGRPRHLQPVGSHTAGPPRA